MMRENFPVCPLLSYMCSYLVDKNIQREFHVYAFDIFGEKKENYVNSNLIAQNSMLRV